MNPRAAAIILEGGRILLVHRKKPGLEYFVLPGGSIEGRESPEVACVREVKEETGLDVAIEAKLFSLTNRSREEHYFLVKKTGGDLRLGEPERSRHCETNQYILVWKTCAEFETANVQPESIRPTIGGLLHAAGNEAPLTND